MAKSRGKEKKSFNRLPASGASWENRSQARYIWCKGFRHRSSQFAAQLRGRKPKVKGDTTKNEGSRCWRPHCKASKWTILKIPEKLLKFTRISENPFSLSHPLSVAVKDIIVLSSLGSFVKSYICHGVWLWKKTTSGFCFT